jgi:hypothetical protein
MAANALWLLLMSCVCDFLTPGIGAPVTIKNHGAMTFSHSLWWWQKNPARERDFSDCADYATTGIIGSAAASAMARSAAGG